MKNKKLISAILAVASIAGGVVGAQAETLADRVEKTENRITFVELDVEANKNNIQNNTANIVKNKLAIDAEATARKDAGQKLQTQIDKNGYKADAALKVAGNGAMQNGETNLTDGVNQNTRLVEAEATARKDADQKLNAKIDSNAAKVQEQLDAQDNKNKAQDESIKANGAAIKANKDAIKANADAIKANKAEADEQHKYLNSRIENNTANIDKNKVAIENEATARKDADQKLQKQIDTNKKVNKNQQQNIDRNSSAIKTLQDNWKDSNRAFNKEQVDKIDKNGIKADTALQVIGNGVMYNHANNLTDGVNLNTKLVGDEAAARKDADKTLQTNIDKEVAARTAGDNALNSRIDQVGSDATKGIAKASALAALHPLDYDPDNKFDIAAAGGFYKGENAFALGAFYRPNRNVMLSMGTTLTSGDNAYNVGLTFKIGKSGKHTEAGLTTADLYAMIGAMQDKMDQQQKKIEELEAKQAK